MPYGTVLAMATTIAVRDTTVERLKRIMKERGAKSLDRTINILIDAVEGIPPSMFGVDREKGISLTRQEHEEFQKAILFGSP